LPLALSFFWEELEEALELDYGPQVIALLQGLLGKSELLVAVNGDLGGKESAGQQKKAPTGSRELPKDS